jgi:pantoate--beta-alanine ligase
VTQLVHSLEELAAARAWLGGSIGLVPTMGALHEGHAALIRAARSSCDAVVVSIFVNPMQFDQAEDLARYPRPIEADIVLCERLGADLVWNPDVDTLYPDGPVRIRVTAGELADQLEGPNRPGHFDGVLTIVTKLFAAVRPDRAYFGEKDYQQLSLIRRMVRDLGSSVQIVGVPTVRDADGLALSSRNVFLSADQRPAALSLSKALRSGAAAAGSAHDVLDAARAALDEASGVQVEYLELRSPELGPVPASGPARLLVAGRVGRTRLIDNVEVELQP